MTGYLNADSYDTYVPERWTAVTLESGLAYMVPAGDDALLESARSWAGDRQYEEISASADPVEGVEVVGTATRSSRESNRSVFRVRDPRGFTLEVGPENMHALMQDVIIRRGRVQTPVAWARSGPNNVLLAKQSAALGSAVRSGRARRGDGLSIGDIELGWDVEIQRGIRGRYLGRWDLIVCRRSSRHTPTRGVRRQYSIECNTNRRYAFMRDDGVAVIHGSPKPHLLHDDSETVSYAEAARTVNGASEIITASSEYGKGTIVACTRDRGESTTLVHRALGDPMTRVDDNGSLTGVVFGHISGGDGAVRLPQYDHDDGLNLGNRWSRHTAFLDHSNDVGWAERLKRRTGAGLMHQGSESYVVEHAPEDADGYSSWSEMVVSFETEGVELTVPVRQ